MELNALASDLLLSQGYGEVCGGVSGRVERPVRLDLVDTLCNGVVKGP